MSPRQASKPDQRASVGVALIAKDAAATIGRCLASVRPWVQQVVVGVDERTADKTARIARKHGADDVFPLKVSDWHECPQHGQVLAQHFAEARNESFRHLRRDLDWWLWIDSDDTLEGAEKLSAILAHTPEQVNCIWLPYHYATVQGGKGITTVFDRERFLRTTCEWTWTHRVHETVAPVGVPVVPMRLTGMHVWHQEGVHKSQTSAQRNHLLLEIELEENADDPRTIFYMANGLFAQARWADCLPWYHRTAEHKQANPFERWQSWCYASLAYEQLGDLDSSLQAAWCAIDELPEYKEPYYRLAALALLRGHADQCIHWTKIADMKAEPPYFVFKNPLEYTYNSRTALADAHYSRGEMREALTAAQAAYSAAPSEILEKAIKHYKELIQGAEYANAYVRVAELLEDSGKIGLYDQLPPSVKQFGRARDVAVPAMMRLRQAHTAT